MVTNPFPYPFPLSYVSLRYETRHIPGETLIGREGKGRDGKGREGMGREGWVAVTTSPTKKSSLLYAFCQIKIVHGAFRPIRVVRPSKLNSNTRRWVVYRMLHATI